MTYPRHFSALLFAACAVGCSDGGDEEGSQPSVPAAECSLPNPIRADVADLNEPYEVLTDGSFEKEPTATDAADVQVLPNNPQALQRIKRSQAAARTGDWGYELAAGAQEDGQLTVRTFVDKAEDVGFALWAKSPNGNGTAELVISYEKGAKVIDEYTETVQLSTTWTELSVTNEVKDNFEFVRFGLSIDENTKVYVDDLSVQIPMWKYANHEGATTTVGGLEVPAQPVAPVMFSILIHIEDPQELIKSESYFRRKTAVFEEVSKLFAENGGFLTIQPELEWVLGAQSYDDSQTLGRLASEYGTVYSTHTHGPRCFDQSGKPYGNEACSEPGNWDNDSPITDEAVLTYVQERIETFEQASGTQVRDHNGNWDMAAKGKYGDIDLTTLSAFKSGPTQRTFSNLLTNPWRPSDANTIEDPDTVLTHDPDTNIIYVSGWGQNITKHHYRLPERMRRTLSQAIRYAETGRVNAFYVVTHVDSFFSREGLSPDDYISYTVKDGLQYSDEFLEHLGYWKTMLQDVVKPLVQAGYLQWATVPEMGDAFVAWEAQCAG